MSDRSQWVARIVAALLTLAVGGYVLYKQWPDVQHQLHGYSFAETLPKTIDAAGADARVVSILDRDGDESFAVLTADGRVLERFYGEVCTSSNRGPGSACSNRETHDEHRASGREREQADVRLGDLDPGVVSRLRKGAGIPKYAPVGLRGDRWVVGLPDDAYVANVDGSHLHRARSARELELVRLVSEDPGTR